MARRVPFIERAESVLIATIFVGILFVAQQYSLHLFRFGLVLLVCGTLLQIAVGNVPRHLGMAASLLRVGIILGIVVIVFSIGILLVPYLAQLGR